MFDFSKVNSTEVYRRVYREGKEFMSHLHFGVQGVAKTEEDIMEAWEKVQETGLIPMAFDIEMCMAPMVRKVVGPDMNLHAAVSYPLGRMTLNTKLMLLENLLDVGITDACVCLNWEAIFSKNYLLIEKEVATIMKEFDGKFVRNAFVIPATLMGDSELIDLLKAVDAGGAYSIKINPGAKLGVSFEEIELIKRVFPNRFDIHPSGNIRTLEAIEKYRGLGCNIVHTASALPATIEYMERQLALYKGGMKK